MLAREYLSEIQNYAFDVQWEPNVGMAEQKMLTDDYDLFLIDYRLGGGQDGLELIKLIRDKGILTPAIILTGQGDLRVDMDASTLGASDYLIKSELTSALLERSIRYALSQGRVIKALNEKEKKYRSLFERSIDPIFLITLDMELMDVNESFLQFFGYSLSKLESLPLKDLFTSFEDYQRFASSLKELNYVKDFETSLISHAGEHKYCVLNCVFVEDATSDFCCYEGIIHDLTLRKQAEHEMLIAERLSVTGRIARTIAHEVRNPLTNLNLALDQLRADCSDDESVSLYGEIIGRNAARIEELVGEMLNSSRPKPPDLKVVSVEEVVRSTLPKAIDRINLNSIKVEEDYEPNLKPIHADKEAIQVALLNIIINAIEAMTPGKGILKIKASELNKKICLEINDNGKGISPGDLKHLFAPFFTTKQDGMGLGLTSTRSILTTHGATLKVQSTPGKGTSFYVDFTPSE
jgi:PAS domain S-box-containing protein